MIRRALRVLCGVAVGAVLSSCEHHDVAIQGNADRVLISYVGDLGETQPIARQHCAQYERTAVLLGTKDNTAVYACVRANAVP
jgi:hypothetical protein